MKRVTQGILIVLWLAACFGTGVLIAYVQNPPVKPKVHQGIEFASIVRIVKNNKTICSGVVVSNKYILTAAHCLSIMTVLGPFADPTPTEIRLRDNKPLKVFARIYKISNQLDSAVLEGDFSQFKKSKYVTSFTESNNNRQLGTQLIICGYPLGADLFCNKGSYLDEYGFYMKIKALLIPGMSGGPTMLTDGTVVATNTAVDDNFSLVSPVYGVQ